MSTAKRGRPPIDLDDKIGDIEQLASILTQEQIADFLGVSERTLRRRMMDDERFMAAYTRGRAKAIAKVASNLVQQANGGNVRAIEFYLRTQAGWKDQSQVDITSGGKPLPDTINIRLVAPESD